MMSKLKLSGLSFLGGGAEGFRGYTNNSLKIPKVFGGAHSIDSGMPPIHTGDPQDRLMNTVERIGWPEKFFNKYHRSRVKLAD